MQSLGEHPEERLARNFLLKEYFAPSFTLGNLQAILNGDDGTQLLTNVITKKIISYSKTLKILSQI